MTDSSGLPSESPAPERVALTGATGFIGGHLLRRLLEKGAHVSAIGRPPAVPSIGSESPRIDWRQSDLLDEDRIATILEETRPSVLFHLAGTTGGNGLAESARVNVAGAAAVLQAALRAGVGRIVLMGTAQEYGPLPPPLREDMRVEPETIYGVTKAAATLLAGILHRERAAPIVVVRPFNVYGPGQAPPMLVAAAISAALRGDPFHMSTGEQRRDFVFVEDVIDGVIAAGTARGIEGRIINLASGQAVSVRSVVETIWRLSGAEARLLIGSKAVGKHDRSDSWASVEAARETLGWSAKTALEEGLRATIEATPQ